MLQRELGGFTGNYVSEYLFLLSIDVLLDFPLESHEFLDRILQVLLHLVFEVFLESQHIALVYDELVLTD